MTIKSLKASAESFTLLAADENRKGVTIYNSSSRALYVLLGDGEISIDGDYSVILNPGSYYEPPVSYIGEITARSAAHANGTIKVTNW